MTQTLATAAGPGAREGSAGDARLTRVTVRRWVRRDTPVWPFVWRGLLPLLGLLLLGWYALRPFAQDDIEAVVARHTRATLDAQGHGWARVAVSGQDVTLSGTPPAAGAGDAALALARTVTCPTWSGERICPVSVRGDFGQPAAASAAASATAPVAAAPASAPAAAPAPAPKVEAAAARACETSLAEIVERRGIAFDSGSAVIDAREDALLDRIAQAARQCPGTLRVEGHTDAIGSVEANRALAQARADAVVAALARRGLDTARLQAEGVGPDRPRADNATAAGRARNRRIEFHVVQAGR